MRRLRTDLCPAYLIDQYSAATLHGSGRHLKPAPVIRGPVREITSGSHPEHWPKIAVGDVVLASEGYDDGWWEAKVVGAVQERDNYLLSWSHWLEHDQFTRHVTQLTLLHPKFATEAPE